MATITPDPTVEPISEAPSTPAPSAGRRWLGSGWAWMTVAVLLIGTSGWLRAANDRQIGRERAVMLPCPFDLDQLPDEIDGWASQPGTMQKLDARTIQITGSTKHTLRTYTNSLTGVQIAMVLLYGPAEPVLPHIPDVCYPATGFALENNRSTVPVDFNGETALFRAGTYVRPMVGGSQRVRVYHSFRYNDHWSPDGAAGVRFYRSNPGIFKIQAQRILQARERVTSTEPLDQFMKLMLAEIERKIAQGEASQPQTPVEIPKLAQADQSRPAS